MTKKDIYYRTHEKNKKLLIKEGFTIINYINTSSLMVLYAKHKDGRTVDIRC